METPIWNGKQNSLTGPITTGSIEKRAPGEVDITKRMSLKVFLRSKIILSLR